MHFSPLLPYDKRQDCTSANSASADSASSGVLPLHEYLSPQESRRLRVNDSMGITSLRPFIKPRTWLNTRPLSADGFADLPVCLALSKSLVVVFQSGGVLLSQRSLDRLGFSVHAAWDACALNLERAARTADGIEFFTRSASRRLGKECPPGVEVRIRGTIAQSWIAHPQTFTIVHRHLQQLCLVKDFVYVVPDDTSLFAFFGDPATNINRLKTLLTFPAIPPLVWSNGFPAEVESNGNYIRRRT